MFLHEISYFDLSYVNTCYFNMVKTNIKTEVVDIFFLHLPFTSSCFTWQSILKTEALSGGAGGCHG